MYKSFQNQGTCRLTIRWGRLLSEGQEKGLQGAPDMDGATAKSVYEAHDFKIKIIKHVKI